MMRGLVSKALGTHEGYLGIAYLSCRELGTEKARPADIVPRAASFSCCCLEPSRLRRRAAIARKISLEIAGHSRSSRQNPSSAKTMRRESDSARMQTLSSSLRLANRGTLGSWAISASQSVNCAMGVKIDSTFVRKLDGKDLSWCSSRILQVFSFTGHEAKRAPAIQTAAAR